MFEPNASPFGVCEERVTGTRFRLSTLVLRCQHYRRNLANKSGDGGGGAKSTVGIRSQVTQRAKTSFNQSLMYIQPFP